MKSAVSAALLLLLLTGAVTARDLQHEAAAQRQRRGLLDNFWSRGATPRPTDATPPAGGAGELKLADALNRGPKTSKPAGGNTGRFNLEDALRPAQKPTADPTGGNCQGNLVEKMNAVIENQNQQLRLLRQMIPTSRFYVPRTR